MSRAAQVAFPADSRESRTFAGLSVREYFAAMAMQGLIARGFVSATEKSRGLSGTLPLMERDVGLAEMAVRHADALIAQLAKVES